MSVSVWRRPLLTDLPHSLARRLCARRLPSAEGVQAARLQLQALLQAMTLMCVTDGVAPDITPADEWQRAARASKLWHFARLLDELREGPIDRAELDRVRDVGQALTAAGVLPRLICARRRTGLLLTSYLLDRAARRMEESLQLPQADQAGTLLLRQQLARLRAAPGPVPESALDGTLKLVPVAVSTLHGQRLRAEALREGTTIGLALLGEIWPIELLESEREVLRQADPSGAAVAAACLSIWPTDELRQLLALHAELLALGPVALAFAVALEDSERLLWAHGRSLLREVLHQATGLLLNPATDRARREWLLFHLGYTMAQARVGSAPADRQEQVLHARTEWHARLHAIVDLDLI